MDIFDHFTILATLYSQWTHKCSLNKNIRISEQKKKLRIIDEVAEVFISHKE